MEHIQEDDLVRVKELLRHTGEFIAYFELAETKMMEWRQEIELQASRLQQQQEKLTTLTEQSLEKISKHGAQTVHHISSELTQFNPHHFQRIAIESCEQVRRSANDAVNKSHKLLHMIQLRFIFFAAITTLLTSFIIVLYLSGELPWEMHHHAKNERKVGKALLQAWPTLSQDQKTKILEYVNNS